jgi:hypothetical protein
MRVSHKILIEFDDNLELIVTYPQWVPDHQLRPQTIYLLDNIVTFYILTLYILFNSEV